MLGTRVFPATKRKRTGNSNKGQHQQNRQNRSRLWKDVQREFDSSAL